MNSFKEQKFTGKTGLSTWKVVLKAVFSDKKNALGMIVFIVLLAILDIVYPLFNKYAIDKFFVGKDFSNTGLFIFVYAAIGVLMSLSVYEFFRFAGNIDASTSYQLRKQAYEKLQKLSFSYFDKTPQGWIMSRMASDTHRLAEFISWGSVDFIWGFLKMIGVIIVLMIINMKLAVIILCLTPIMLGVSILSRKLILKHHRDARRKNSLITGAISEGLMGSQTTKSLVIEEQNENEFNAISKSYRKSALKAIIYSSLLGPAVFIIGYTGVALTLYNGGGMVLNGIITIGTLYLFVDYTIKYFEPILNISRILAELQDAQAAAERIVALIETKPEITDSEDVIKKYGSLFSSIEENWEKMDGDIEFKNVTFKYGAGETVLSKFNLKVKAGETIALVGHTGSGKSTIVNLLCRFYEPTSGSILIDGIDYKKRSISWLHKNLGYVLQSPHLFSGTIMENIRYGKLTATNDEVIAAAKIVKADEFIMKTDKGYNSLVGEGGNKLSNGEKQLISFARAILAEPRILILDEATSSIDTLKEFVIQEAIGKVLEGRTSFAIAHRLSTIVAADRIIVLDKGKIVEQGNHNILLNKKGYYYELYKNQFLRELEEKIT